ncbi:hypothetical protein N665_0502s0002 [Sinapis alba]|nr:hypothetical protein N665_0502s0002 [Sinapis alba]
MSYSLTYFKLEVYFLQGKIWSDFDLRSSDHDIFHPKFYLNLLLPYQAPAPELYLLFPLTIKKHTTFDHDHINFYTEQNPPNSDHKSSASNHMKTR